MLGRYTVPISMGQPIVLTGVFHTFITLPTRIQGEYIETSKDKPPFKTLPLNVVIFLTEIKLQ
jgi:hypothetical protein